MRKFILGTILLLFSACVMFQAVHASEMTVIIVDTNTSECRVLESDALDQAIPEGWIRVDLTREQCAEVLPRLQGDKSFDENVQDYLALLSCDKENNLRSLSYFGLGGKEICKAAGYDYAQGRLVTAADATPLPKQQPTTIYAIGIVLLVLLVLVLLILVKRKRKNL
jgi:hypothetical protein